MNKLSIHINEDYKSFESGFSFCLEGNLLILSGVNGSGKSQLIDIISQRVSYGSKKTINATIKVDDQEITRNYILRRSFKENINVPELTRAGAEVIADHKNNAWKAYSNYRLDHNHEKLWDYKESSEHAKEILIEEFGGDKFKKKEITETDFKNTLPTDFVWRSDDIFTNFIGELFFNYAIQVFQAKAKAGEVGEKFDSAIMPTAPWKQLNDLFSELGFEYRFKDNYYIENLQINEQPCLFQIDNNGFINEDQPRKLADLSDGEKAIISLSFASLSGVKHEDKKVLLLDEFDANFNPSLTEVFYKILDKYFISQGILVVIATHSATTIALAPDNASFYEVFKKSSALTSRILPVQRDDYTELEIANKNFYAKIADQEGRITELEKEKEEYRSKVDELSQISKPSLFVEGNIDIQYLNKAAEYDTDWKNILDGFDVKEKNGKGDLKKYWRYRQQIREFLQHQVVLLFDYDANEANENDNLIYKRVIPIQSRNSIKKGIENLFSDNLISRAEDTTGKRFVKKTIPDADNPDKQEWVVIDKEKKNLADWICANASKEDFDKFNTIFSLLKEISTNT